MQITPASAPDTRVHLHCVPKIRYGETEMVTRPTEDGASHLLVPERPVKDFEDLAFDVTLEINQYLVIGGRSDHVGTLGWRCFWRGDEPVPAQRLLVIRTCRPGVVPNEGSEEPANGDKSRGTCVKSPVAATGVAAGEFSSCPAKTNARFFSTSGLRVDACQDRCEPSVHD